jgi:recombinational DNA repair ATPase RecF
MITNLVIDNFQRIRAVNISPRGRMVEIRGKNGQGKSSVLDAIECLFAGGNVLPKQPIRRGAEIARIIGHIQTEQGEIIVTRRFTPGGSHIVAEAASGARFRSPQHFLDALFNALCFDPLRFASMPGPKQVEILRRAAKLDVDIDALDGLNARDYEQRTDINRDAKRLRGQASGIQYPDGLPAAPIDIGALTERLRQAGDDNALLERRRANRERAANEAAGARVTAKGRRDEAERLRRQADDLDRTAAELEAHAAQIDQDLANAEPLPAPVDTAPLAAALETAHTVNMHLDAKARRETLEAEAAALEARAQALTDAMAARTAQKVAAIAKAKMPIAGLGLGDGEVLFNDLPFDQASQGEQITVSVAIAMAMKPEVRVVCVRDGSLLDEDSLRLLEELAEKHDFQCFVEVMDNDATTGIIIEDGTARIPGPKPDAQSALNLLEV